MVDNNRDKVLACLTEAGEPLSIRNITATTGLKTTEVKEALDALKTEDRAASAKSGRTERWSLTNPEASPEVEPAEAAPESPEPDVPAEAAPTGPEPAADNVEPAPPEAETPPPESTDEATAETGDDAKAVEPLIEEDSKEDEEDDDDSGTPVPVEKAIDPEVVFAATMLDQFPGFGSRFTAESFAETCGKTTAAERNRLLRALWALAEHGQVANSDPNNVDGGTWTVESSTIAAAAIQHCIQVTDAPDEIEVRTVKRMPWAANGGARSSRSLGSGLRGDLKPARVRGELRGQINAILGALESGEVVTPGWVAEAVRKDDPHHRDADPNAVNNYLKELQLGGKLTDATAETGQRAYRLV